MAALCAREKAPLHEAIVSALTVKPKILERKPIVQRIADRLMRVITTFDDA